MKRIKQFTYRMLAATLAGMLAVGSVTVFAFGAEDVGRNESAAAEISFEETNEDNTIDVSAVDEKVEGGVPKLSEAEEVVEEDVTESNNAAFADTSEMAVGDDAALSYKVTLDANGGYFINELDDVLNETVEKAYGGNAI